MGFDCGPCTNLTFSHSSHDNNLDPSTSTNQLAKRGEGFFPSLFDCLLARVQDEIRGETEEEDGATENLLMRASSVHSHLLTGLLGADLHKFTETEEHLRNMHNCLSHALNPKDEEDLNKQTPQKLICKKGVLGGLESSIVPETPTGADVMAGEDSGTSTPDSSISDEFLISTKANRSNLSLSDSVSKFQCSSLGNTPSRKLLTNTSINTTGETSLGSFFAQLDDFDCVIDDRDSFDHEHVDVDERRSLLTTAGNDQLPCDLFDRESRTPAGHRSGHQQAGQQQQSPFVKNFSSERVTRRRRKRRMENVEQDKENTSADDSLLLKQFCEGTAVEI